MHYTHFSKFLSIALKTTFFICLLPTFRQKLDVKLINHENLFIYMQRFTECYVTFFLGLLLPSYKRIQLQQAAARTTENSS